MSTEEKPPAPKESQKTSLEETQETPAEIEFESQGCDGPNSHKWDNKMEVQRRLSGKPDLEIVEKRTVLFVDDDEIVLESLEEGLLDESYHKLFAKSGQEALEILQREEVHVIVTDMCMPEMTGLELLRTIRKEYPNIIGIILTGYELDAELEKAVNHREVFRLVAKPLWKLGGKFEKLIRWSLDNYNLQLTR
jgi:CheY-like chemotaxis protein